MKRTYNNIWSLTFLLIIIAILAPVTLTAQQVIDPTLEVRRDFDGKLKEIIKSKLPTKVADSVSRFNLSFDYRSFNRPVRDLYEFSPLPSAQIAREERLKSPIFMAEISAGYPLTPGLNLSLQPNLKDGLKLLLFANHDSYLGKINEIKAPEFNTLGGAAFEYSWRLGRTGLALNGSNNLLSLHGFGNAPFIDSPQELTLKYMTDTLSRRTNSYGANFYLESTNPSTKAFNYLLLVDYKHANDLSKFDLKKVSENYYNIKADIGPTFGEHHKVLVSANLEGVQSENTPDANRISITAHPRYLFTHKRWLLELGAKINKSIEPQDENFNLYVRAKASIALIPQYLWFYAETDGGRIFRSFSTLLKDNPYISQSIEIKNGEIPFSGKLGFKGEIGGLFSYHIFGEYARIKNEIFYKISNDTIDTGMKNVFLADYASLNKLSAGGELSWRSNDFEARGRVVYNYLNRSDSLPSYNHAPLEAGLFARYNYKERISAGAEVLYKSSMQVLDRTGTTIDTDRFISLNIFANYVLTSKFSIYIRGNNLLNTKSEWLADYYYRGINIKCGVIITL